MCAGLVSVVLIIINVLIGIVGAALSIFGAIMTWSKAVAYRFVDDLIKTLAKGISGFDQERSSKIAGTLLDVSKNYSLAIFICGMIIVCICVLGCIGACCRVKCLLIVYIALLGVIFLIHLILIIIYFTRKDIPKKYLGKFLANLVENYVSLESKESPSVLLGIIMGHFQCCGLTNGADFQNSKFSKRDSYNGQVYTSLQYPLPCCKMNNSFEIVDKSCPRVFNDQNSNYKTGCKEPFENQVIYYLNIAAYISIIVLIGEVVLIILGVMVLKCK